MCTGISLLPQEKGKLCKEVRNSYTYNNVHAHIHNIH